jgi:hypothetical protein
LKDGLPGGFAPYKLREKAKQMADLDFLLSQCTNSDDWSKEDWNKLKNSVPVLK